jgi:hypothetical protein
MRIDFKVRYLPSIFFRCNRAVRNMKFLVKSQKSSEVAGEDEWIKLRV